MIRRLAQPALQVLGAGAALLGTAWPLIVVERPTYVFVSMFATWAAFIGLLFVFSRAEDKADHAPEAAPEAGGEDG